MAGFDAGTIVDGVVIWDGILGRYVLVDEDGVGFDPHSVLEGLDGKRVRLTMVSFEAMDKIEQIVRQSGVELSLNGDPIPSKDPVPNS